MDPILNVDLYELIGAKLSSSVAEIKKAYRKKALSCHPDKNPDNPRAAELFHELSKALEILTDTSARAAYDKVIAARQQAKVRAKELDAKRQKLKNDLEERESAYLRSINKTNTSFKSDEQVLQAEIERLRKEGSKQVEEEVAFVKKQIYEQLYGKRRAPEGDATCRRVKIRWKADQNDSQNGGYTYDILHQILSKYGDITALIVSSTKKGRALVEFENRDAAETAVQIEIGLSKNPLILKALWNSEPPLNSTEKDVGHSNTLPRNNLFPIQKGLNDHTSPSLSFSSAPNIFVQQNKMSDSEFESSVLTNLRRAEERKRIIEQLQKEDT